MSVSGSIPATVQIRRDHLLGLIGAVAALAACITWAVTAFAFDTGTSGAVSSSHATATGVAAAQRAPRRPSATTRGQVTTFVRSTQRRRPANISP
jgi:hypothetical protein